MTERKRARTDSAKEEKRQRLVTVARSLFAGKEYSGITVEEIAASAGMAKGTVFVYFPTKEELFLSAARELFEGFFDALRKGLLNPAGGSERETLGRIITDALEGQGDFLRMIPLLGVLIEKNVSSESLAGFKRYLLEELISLGRLADGRFPFLAEGGGGTQFLFRIYGVVIGFLNLAEPVETARKIIEQEGMTPFRFDFKKEFRDFLALVLRGF